MHVARNTNTPAAVHPGCKDIDRLVDRQLAQRNAETQGNRTRIVLSVRSYARSVFCDCSS